MHGGSCCKQLHQMRGHGRAAVTIHRGKGSSGSMRFEVHSALPTLLLHLSGANNCAAGGTGLVLIQGDRGASTFGVVRAYRLCGVARRVSRGPKRVEIGPIADEPDLHITPFRLAPINIEAALAAPRPAKEEAIRGAVLMGGPICRYLFT